MNGGGGQALWLCGRALCHAREGAGKEGRPSAHGAYVRPASPGLTL